MRKLALTGIMMFSLCTMVFAHGVGQYLQLDSYDYQEKGAASFYIRYDYMAPDKLDARSDRWEMTPGFSYTVIDGLCLDAHFHFAKFGVNNLESDSKNEYDPLGPPPFIEAAALGFQYNLPQLLPVDIAFALEYEIPFDRAKKLLGAGEVVESKVVLGRDFGNHSNISLNLIAEIEDSDTEVEWGAGIKTPLSRDPHGIAGGIEVFGSFDDLRDELSVLPGIYIPVGHDETVFKTGIEFGKKPLKFTAELAYFF